MLRETPSRCLSSLSFLAPLSPPPVLSTRVCDASSLLILLPLPSSLPPDRSVSSRKLFPDLSSKARERFESIHVSPYPDDDQSVIPSSPPLPPLPRAEKRRIWRRRGSLPSSQLNLKEGFLLIEIEDFFFLLFSSPLCFSSMAKICVTDSSASRAMMMVASRAKMNVARTRYYLSVRGATGNTSPS